VVLDCDFWWKKRDTKRWFSCSAGLWREIDGMTGRKMKIKCRSFAGKRDV